ncbi:MAG: M4 family metallopeptidase, partial [Actinomycetota bacterium]
CVADWDSVSYTVEVPHCLRRVDLDLTVADANGGIHHDGQIWSRALWDIHQALGRTTADRIILEAQFSFAPDTSWRDAARDTVAAARSLSGNGAANVVQDAFEDRGIL